MKSEREITQGIFAVGSRDLRLARFENLFPVPDGVTYNAYVIVDEKIAILDGADAAVSEEYFSEVERVLNGRIPDYIVVHHMEPDHSATLRELMRRYPSAVPVGNAKTQKMFADYAGEEAAQRMRLVEDGEELVLGARRLKFMYTPMVHWPESMMSYETESKTLFSQDAFGAFGAEYGSDFDDVFSERYADEMRRYYVNIVGKYGPSVKNVLQKAEALEVRAICPLHGMILRRHIKEAVEKYRLWSEYEPERRGVLVVYASMYGNVKRAAQRLTELLASRGIETRIRDVSETDLSVLTSETALYSHVVAASVTYNASIFPAMERYLADLKALGVSGRAFGLIEGGSWSPIAAKLMKARVEELKNCRTVGEPATVRGGRTDETALTALADAIAADVQGNR